MRQRLEIDWHSLERRRRWERMPPSLCRQEEPMTPTPRKRDDPQFLVGLLEIGAVALFAWGVTAAWWVLATAYGW